MPVLPPAPTAEPPPETGSSTQVHALGQSVSALHVVAFGWQLPGNDVVDVHSATLPDEPVAVPSLVGVATSPLTAEPPAPDDEPEGAVPPPERVGQVVCVDGTQLNAAPQSLSVLHASCQR